MLPISPRSSAFMPLHGSVFFSPPLYVSFPVGIVLLIFRVGHLCVTFIYFPPPFPPLRRFICFFFLILFRLVTVGACGARTWGPGFYFIPGTHGFRCVYPFKL